MTLTKWNAELIEGLDESVDGEMGKDYLPLEGGTLTGELTVDANLTLEGGIIEGDRLLKKYSTSSIIIPRVKTSKDGKETVCIFPENRYILTPSQGTMQHFIGSKASVNFILETVGIPESQSDQDYLFEDGQSMTIRIEVHDLATPLGARIPFLYTWPEEIWWVNTKDGLAPDVNKTGAITVTLWKAKGIVYGQLAGDFVEEPEYPEDAFDMSKIRYNSQYGSPNVFDPSEDKEGKAGVECRIYGPDPELKGTEWDWPQFVHEPQPGHQGKRTYGITQRGGVTFTRTSRDGMHHFLGQTGSKDNPGEYRTFTNSLPSEMTTPDGYNERGVVTPLEIHHKFHCGARTILRQGSGGGHNNTSKLERHDLAPMYTESPKLLGTAVDMRLRVEKGSGIDFNPDGTKMFQSVSNYLDPSLADKYENVIGAHHLAEPWNVGATDFLIKEELNDIIYCDEKYSELRARHPSMKVCCLTFRPDGMSFYFAFVVHEVSKNLRYYFVQQNLEVPWELSSAKDDYKYSKLFTHEKFGHYGNVIHNTSGYKWPIPDNMYPNIEKQWHINCITVSQNGRFMHVIFPHCVWEQHIYTGIYSEKPRQFEMTTHWDMSTAELSWIGLGPICLAEPMTTNGAPGQANVNKSHGGTIGGYKYGLAHGIHWNNAGTRCYTSFVPETNTNSSTITAVSANGRPLLNTCHYFNQKGWILDPNYEHWDGT